MSRIGLKPIEIPNGVKITMDEDIVTVTGAKGELTRSFENGMKISIADNEVNVARPSDKKEDRSLHGTTRSLIYNMVQGVIEGFERKLELVGVGYRATKSGDKLVLTVGHSHPVEIVPEKGIEIDVPTNTEITVSGIDKERVGAVAANIRAVRSPEPYKGKGIRYKDEYVRRKEGKTGK